jgi:hypothetical protein
LALPLKPAIYRGFFGFSHGCYWNIEGLFMVVDSFCCLTWRLVSMAAASIELVLL